MAEPNANIVKSRPNIPNGNEPSTQHNLPTTVARNAGVSVPAVPEPDDYQHLNSLAKNAPVSSGDTDNFDINPAIQPNRIPVDRYASKSGVGLPIPQS